MYDLLGMKHTSVQVHVYRLYTIYTIAILVKYKQYQMDSQIRSTAQVRLGSEFCLNRYGPAIQGQVYFFIPV